MIKFAINRCMGAYIFCVNYGIYIRLDKLTDDVDLLAQVDKFSYETKYVRYATANYSS